jgi:serine/threonine protein kinase
MSRQELRDGILERALALLPQQRESFLAEACGEDTDLRLEIDRLLAANQQMSSQFLEHSEAPAARQTFLEDGLLEGAVCEALKLHPSGLGGRFRDTGDLNPTAATLNIGTESGNQALLNTRLKKRYLLERELGRGGFGVVYLAADEQLLPKRVVIKIMRNAAPDAWERRKFRNEIAALARLNHPSIVSVLDSGETPEGRPFLVMEYVEGTSLRSLIRPDGMNLDCVADIIRQVGRALDAAHRKGIWHRDLKPENILIETLGDGEQRIKLIDFGVATVEDSEAQTDSSTRIAGTIRYMAPEQIRGKPSAASDTYSLGIVVYEMVTGRTPFSAKSAVELYAMQTVGVQVGPKTLRPALPAEAERSILKALHFSPAHRHQNVTTFVHDIVRALRAASTTATLVNGKEPHQGRLVSKMCDRRSQEDEFRAFLMRRTMGNRCYPMLCLIHGDEGECHESLVERLAHHAALASTQQKTEEDAPVKIVKIPWQYEGPPEVRFRRLVAWIFERLVIDQALLNLSDTSSAALGALLKSLRVSFVFLQHDIRAARWDEGTRSLIQSYRRYLATLPWSLDAPYVIVCINVIYPYRSTVDWRRLLFNPIVLFRNLGKSSIHRHLMAIAAEQEPCECLLLDELKPISRDDVLEWFSLHNILETEEQRLTAASRIFGNSAATGYKRMAEIETQLKDVQRNFLLEQGFI